MHTQQDFEKMVQSLLDWANENKEKRNLIVIAFEEDVEKNGKKGTEAFETIAGTEKTQVAYLAGEMLDTKSEGMGSLLRKTNKAVGLAVMMHSLNKG